jgi:hypothetical protein
MDYEKPLSHSISKAMNSLIHNIYAMLSGLFASIIGYFLPIKDIVHLLILFFFLDVFFGYLAARKLRKERFSVKIIWSHTMPRMLISIVLIIGAYMWDATYGQEIVCTYKVIGWFISGVLLYSISENGYLITKWSIFPRISGLIRTKIYDKAPRAADPDNKPEDGK